MMTFKTLLLVVVSLTVLVIAHSGPMKKKHVVCLEKKQLPNFVRNSRLPAKQVRQLFCRKRKRSPDRRSSRKQNDKLTTAHSKQLKKRDVVCLSQEELPIFMINNKLVDKQVRQIYCSKRKRSRRVGASQSTRGRQQSTGRSPRRTGRALRKRIQNTFDYCTVACVFHMRLPLAVNGSENCITLEANIKYTPLRNQDHTWLFNGTPLTTRNDKSTKAVSEDNPLGLKEVATRRVDIKVEPRPGTYMLRVTSFKEGTDVVEHYRECCVAGLEIECRQDRICRDNMTKFSDSCREEVQ